MLSNRQLRNFKRYLATTPRADWGKPPTPAGAYDSRAGSHGFRARGLDMRHFDFGGAFDAIGETDSDSVTKAMRFIASKLSKADWAQFQLVLNGEHDDDGAQDDTFSELMADPNANPRPRSANDAPFPGREGYGGKERVIERPVGGRAMDSGRRRGRASSFEDVFPDAAPVRHI